jgi:hypothetical protein
MNLRNKSYIHVVSGKTDEKDAEGKEEEGEE